MKYEAMRDPGASLTVLEIRFQIPFLYFFLFIYFFFDSERRLLMRFNDTLNQNGTLE